METQQEFLFIDGYPDAPAPTSASSTPASSASSNNGTTSENPAPPAPPASSANSIPHSTEESIIEEIRAAWRMPFIRQRVRVALRGCPVDEMNGLLEIAEPFPDYPFNPAKPLRLRIDSITFTTAQITSCALL